MMAAMELLVAVVCFVLGLVFGSFANVVIHRVPAGLSIVAPASACPSCDARIKPYDNIPVVSWLALRGRCRSCRAPISGRYPLVELAMGLVFAAVGARFGLDWALPGFLLLAWLLVVVAVIDAQTRKIPNRLTYPLTPAIAVLLIGAALIQGELGVAVRTLLGGVIGFGGLLILALISPRGMGMGDVKLAASIGLGCGYLGWGILLVGIFGGFMLGGIVAVTLVVTRLRSRKDLLPFGPYLAAGALIAVLFGQDVVQGYLELTGLA